MKFIKIFFILFMFCITYIGIETRNYANADTEKYTEYKKELQKLRNTDTSIKKFDKWTYFTDKILSLSSRLPTLQKAEASLLVAKSYIDISKKTGDQKYLEQAIIIFNEIIKDYSDTHFAPVALYELYQVNKKHSPELAQSYLDKIIERYPQSEYATFAKEAKKHGLSNISDKTLSANHNQIKQDNNKFIVVLDPGHGGEDLGAVGVGGILEKDIVLHIGKLTKDYLDKESSIVTYLTRNEDIFVPLQERTEFANSKQANVFVSIHVNASETKKQSGFELYLLDEQGDKASQLLVERENASLANNDIILMLADLIQTSKNPASKVLANNINNYLKKNLNNHSEYKNASIKSIKKAPFYVLVGAFMPAVLVEFFYIDNEQDGVWLSEKIFRQILAKSLTQAIVQFKLDSWGS